MSRRIIRLAGIVVVLVLVGLFVIIPFLYHVFGPPTMGTGSYRHARLWRDKLLTCDSLDDVRGRFNCGRYEWMPGESYRYVTDPNTHKKGQTSALLCEFSDGRWLAAAYASSHNQWGGGTVVTRDSTGRIRVFFGHVCGKPYIHADSLDQAYVCFSGSEWEEVQLDE